MKHTFLKLLSAILLLAPLAALHAAEPPATFCNPLPIPNYPIGFFARNVIQSGKGCVHWCHLARGSSFRFSLRLRCSRS